MCNNTKILMLGKAMLNNTKKLGQGFTSVGLVYRSRPGICTGINTDIANPISLVLIHLVSVQYHTPNAYFVKNDQRPDQPDFRVWIPECIPVLHF
jgi:hypothetical protein